MHFTWLTPPGPYRATACRERVLTLDNMHIFLITQGYGGSPRMRDQLNAGAISETVRKWKTSHTSHASIHSNKENMKGWLWRPNDIRGPYRHKASWHMSYTWEKLRKNLTEKTCSDPGSNPGPLRNRRACYRLLHSCGLLNVFNFLKYNFTTLYYFISMDIN